MLDEIVKRSSINFPWGLTLEQTGELVKYIATKLPADINYSLSMKSKVLGGSISHKEKSLKFIPFQMYSKKNESKLAGLRFPLSPEWEMGGRRPKEMELWDDVRAIIDDYFTNGS